MKIFFNGDSHTSGSELYFPKEQAYPYRLAKLLGAEVVGNLAVGGASNDRIERTTNEFLNSCNGDYPDLIIIGWSEVYRTDWFFNGRYGTYNSEDLTPEAAEEFNPGRWEYERLHLMNGKDTPSALTKYFQSRIYNYHCYLEHLKIPHLFFMGVHGMEDYLLKSLEGIYKFDWNNSFWNPYEQKPNNSFVSWGVDKGYNLTKYWHLPEEAHQEFAKVLYDHLIQFNIIGS